MIIATGSRYVDVSNLLSTVHSYITQAEMYDELFDAFDPETSDLVEYENYYNRILKK